MGNTTNNYPANLSIDYPEKSNKLTVLFRIFLIIPVFIVFCLIVGKITYGSNSRHSLNYVSDLYYGAGMVFIPTILMILFRKKYPRWWFEWNISLTKFAARVFSYLVLLRDEYPSTDDEQAVHIDISYPDAENDLRRGMPLIKWFLVIPHVIILVILFIAVILCTVISWFVILVTGNYPRRIFDFVVGVMRWSLRVFAYFFLLVTDQYPPFRLSE